MEIDSAFMCEPCIAVSNDNESMEIALNSVIRCQDLLLKRLHICKPGYNKYTDMSKAAYNALTKAGFDIIVHNVFDPDLVTQGMAIVRIAPNLQLTPDALKTLYRNMEKTHHRHSQFAVSSNIRFDGHDDMFSLQNWVNVLSYGFLLVIMVMDSLRSILNATKYHRTCDLRSQTLSRTYPCKNSVNKPSKFWYLIWTRVSGRNEGDAECLEIVTQKDGGFPYVLRTIHQHMHMSLLNIRWGIFFWIYYLLFSYPWWNQYLPPLPVNVWHTMPWYYKLLSILLYRDMTNYAWIMWYGMHMVLVVGVTAIFYMDAAIYPMTLVGHVLLYPFYVMLSPIIFFYGRIRISRGAYRRFTTPQAAAPLPILEEEEEETRLNE
jgi:hypothetical protein